MFSCIKASRVGEICHPKDTRCISPFSGCLDTCRCYDAFVPTPDGRCRLPTTSFVNEPCGIMGCEFPAKCIAGTCTCMPPYRSMTEEEFWVDPLVTMQCQRTDFSLWSCNGTLIEIPEELRTTTSTTPAPTTTESTTSATTTTTGLTTTTTTTTATTTTTTQASTSTTTELTTTVDIPSTTVTSSPTTETTTPNVKVNVLDPCTRHEECPHHAHCRPNACEGFVCICDESYVKSLDDARCMKAGMMGDSCNSQTMCLSPFAGCMGTCRCYDSFVPSRDGRCKLWSSAFVGEPCGEKGCEFPAKCYDNTCHCVAPYRKMSTEEFWVNPLETSQCHKEDFSLVKCKGEYIDVPHPLRDEWAELLQAKYRHNNSLAQVTTTERLSTTAYQTTIPTTMSWFKGGSDVRGTNLNTNPGSQNLHTSCMSHSQCPSAARCRPNACDGFVCLCNMNYTSSDDNSHCRHAVRVGDPCNKSTEKCLSPFANCAGVCQCYTPFIPTANGRCKLPTAAFVGETCGGRIGCEHPTSCENGVCVCLTPHRRMTEEESWIHPGRTVQCMEESFSRMMCDGHIIDVPDELYPEWKDYIEAYRSQFSTTTEASNNLLSSSPSFLTVETTSTPTDANTTMNVYTSTVNYVTDLTEVCSTHAQCPDNSRCRPKSCEGYVCICNRGFIPSDDKKTCLIAIRVGEICEPEVARCVSPFAACAGTCRCYHPFVPSLDGRCKVKTANFIGESCGRKGCEHPGSCTGDICRCRTPYRRKTAEEFWADPLGTSQCSYEDFSLRMCRGVAVDIPEDLEEDDFYNPNTTYWPDEGTWGFDKNKTGGGRRYPDSDVFPWNLLTTPPNIGFTGGGDGSPPKDGGHTGHDANNPTGNGSGSSVMNPDDWRKYQKSGLGGPGEYPASIPSDRGETLGMSKILQMCISHAQCPDHSYCGPMSCDGYVCLCNPGYVPSDNRVACFPAVLVGDVCNPIRSNCLSPFADCDGTCKCYDVFETSKDGRCKTKTAGFVSDPCGGNTGCEFPATCLDGVCGCVDPYRRLTRNEFWSDVTRTLQCHKKEYALYLCDGRPLEVPLALRNETDGPWQWDESTGYRPRLRRPRHGIDNAGVDTGGRDPHGGGSGTDGTGSGSGSAGSGSGGGDSVSDGTGSGLDGGGSGSMDGTLKGSNSSTNRLNGTRGGLNIASVGATKGSPDGRNDNNDGPGNYSGGIWNASGGSGDGSDSVGNSSGSFGNSSSTSGKDSQSGVSGSGNAQDGLDQSVTGGLKDGSPGSDGSNDGSDGSPSGTGGSKDGSGNTDDDADDRGRGPYPDTGGLYNYVPQGGFHKRIYPNITANKSHTITLSDLQKDSGYLTEISASVFNMSDTSNGSGLYVNPNDGSNLNDTGGSIRPSYTSPAHSTDHAYVGVTHTVKTETLENDQVGAGILSTTLDAYPFQHNQFGTTFDPDMISTSQRDIHSQFDGLWDKENTDKSTDKSGNGQNGSYGRNEFNYGKDTSGRDSDANDTNQATPDIEDPGVNEADISETILMSGSIAAVFLLNMACIVLLIIHRRRKRSKKEEISRTKSWDRSTVSEYDVYRLATPIVTVSRGPFITLATGPYVYIPTNTRVYSKSDKTTSTCVTSSGELDSSGYSTLPETTDESSGSVHKTYFDSLKIPRPKVKKNVNKIFGDKHMTSSVTSRTRSSTMTYTTAEDSNIKYWFCEIPRPLVTFRNLTSKVNGGTWPKTETNPYVDNSSDSIDSHTYEEIMPSNASETSV